MNRDQCDNIKKISNIIECLDKNNGRRYTNMKIEFFSAECRLCQRTFSILSSHFPNIKIDVHKASECKDGSCCALAAQYGVRAVPSLVVDGKLVLVGLPDEQDLKSLACILQDYIRDIAIII